MCTICLIDLQLLGKSLNQYHAKYMHFSKMQLVSHCYTAVLCEPISKLYIYKNSTVYLSDCRVKFSCTIQELRNPTIDPLPRFFKPSCIKKMAPMGQGLFSLCIFIEILKIRFKKKMSHCLPYVALLIHVIGQLCHS